MEMYIKNLLKIAKYKSVPLFGNKQQNEKNADSDKSGRYSNCLLYTSPSPRDATLSRMPSSA